MNNLYLIDTQNHVPMLLDSDSGEIQSNQVPESVAESDSHSENPSLENSSRQDENQSLIRRDNELLLNANTRTIVLMKTFCLFLQEVVEQIDNQKFQNFLNIFQILSRHKLFVFSNHYLELSNEFCQFLSEQEWLKFFNFISFFHFSQSKGKLSSSDSNYILIELPQNHSFSTLTLHHYKSFNNLHLSGVKQWDFKSREGDIMIVVGNKKFFINFEDAQTEFPDLVPNSSVNSIILQEDLINPDEFERILKILYRISDESNPKEFNLCEFVKIAKIICFFENKLLLNYLLEVNFDLKNVDINQINKLKDLFLEIKAKQSVNYYSNKSEFYNKFLQLLQFVFDESVSNTVNLYGTQPFLYSSYGEWLNNNGYHARSLSKVYILGGLEIRLKDIFPNIHKIDIKFVQSEVFKEFSKNLQEIEHINLSFRINCLNLSHLQTCKKIVSFTMQNMTDEENDEIEEIKFVRAKPFLEPSKMFNLRKLGLCYVNLKDDRILNSIKELPNLESLFLEKCKNINFKALEILFPKLKEFELVEPKYSDKEKEISFKRLYDWKTKFKNFNFTSCLNAKEFDVLIKKWLRGLNYNEIIILNSQEKKSEDHLMGINGRCSELMLQRIYKLMSIISSQESKVYDFTQAQEHLVKMRYSDILPYDHNNINQELGFVLNASPIQKFNGGVRIATQGPLSHTIADFWSAVWKMNTELIVMLTPCIENKEKCAKYWPSLQEKLQLVGPLGEQFEVTLIEQEKLDYGIKRKFLLRLNNLQRTIEQFHYEEWNDQSSLDNLKLRSIVNIVKALEEKSKAPPFIHCSAGIGRTGVLIACLIIKEIIDSIKEQAKKDNSINITSLSLDVEKLLLSLRRQRKGMIQTVAQMKNVIDFFLNEIGKFSNR